MDSTRSAANTQHGPDGYKTRVFAMKLSDMRMAMKLALGFGLITVLTVVLGLLSLVQFQKINADMQFTGRNVVVGIKYLGDLRVQWNRVRRLEESLRGSKTLDEFATYERELQTVRSLIDQSEKALNGLLNEAGNAALADYQRQRDAYLNSHNTFLHSARTAVTKRQESLQWDRTDNDAEEQPGQQAQMPAISDAARFIAVVEGLGRVTDLGLQHAEEARAKVQQSYDTTKWMLLSGIVLVALLAVAIGAAITRAITQPVQQAIALARGIAQGDLTHPVHPTGTNEVNQLLRALEDMRNSLSRMVGSVRHNATGVAAASEEIAHGNTDLSDRTEEQANALQQTAHSTEQLALTVRHNADTARQANQMATNASTVASQGGEVVHQVVETMKGINDSSRKISEIIGVIDGIAFQTNILALNAAVEAARAGEDGRGFAVVAGEVRSLAGRSAEAAKQIKELITDSVARVDEGGALVDKAGATMAEVVQAIRQVADLVGEISAASQEQSQGVAQVGSVLGQMEQSTQQNAALVEQSAAAADKLKNQSRELLDMVASYRIIGGESAAAASLHGNPGSAALKPTARPLPAKGRSTADAPASTTAVKPVTMASSPPATPAAALPKASTSGATRPPAKAASPEPAPSTAPRLPASAPKINEDDWESF